VVDVVDEQVVRVALIAPVAQFLSGQTGWGAALFDQGRQPEHGRQDPVDVRRVLVVGKQWLVDQLEPSVDHRERDLVGPGVLADCPDEVAQKGGLAGLRVAEHHQQWIVGEVDGDGREVFLALADDDPVRRRVQRREFGGRQLGG
jgi:hypothetical protein